MNLPLCQDKSQTKRSPFLLFPFRVLLFSYLSVSVISDCRLCFKSSLASGDSCQEREGRRWHPKLAASWLKPLECGLSDPRGMEELILNRICITKSYRKQQLQSLSAGGGPVFLINAQSDTRSAWKNALPPVTPALRRFHDCGGNRRCLLYVLLTNLTEFSAGSVGRLRKMMTQSWTCRFFLIKILQDIKHSWHLHPELSVWLLVALHAFRSPAPFWLTVIEGSS